MDCRPVREVQDAEHAGGRAPGGKEACSVHKQDAHLPGGPFVFLSLLSAMQHHTCLFKFFSRTQSFLGCRGHLDHLPDHMAPQCLWHLLL